MDSIVTFISLIGAILTISSFLVFGYRRFWTDKRNVPESVYYNHNNMHILEAAFDIMISGGDYQEFELHNPKLYNTCDRFRLGLISESEEQILLNYINHINHINRRLRYDRLLEQLPQEFREEYEEEILDFICDGLDERGTKVDRWKFEFSETKDIALFIVKLRLLGFRKILRRKLSRD